MTRDGLGGSIYQAMQRISLDLDSQATADDLQKRVILPGPRHDFLRHRASALKEIAEDIVAGAENPQDVTERRQAVAFFLAASDFPGKSDAYRYALGKLERLERALGGEMPTTRPVAVPVSASGQEPQPIRGKLHVVGQMLHVPGADKAHPVPELLVVNEENVIVHRFGPEPGDDPEGFAMAKRAWNYIAASESGREALDIAVHGFQLPTRPEPKKPLPLWRRILRAAARLDETDSETQPTAAESADPYADLRLCPDTTY